MSSDQRYTDEELAALAEARPDAIAFGATGIPRLVLERFPVLALPPGQGGPCVEAVAWLCSLPADTTVEAALRACPKPEWLVWLFARSGPGGTVPEHCGAILATLGHAEYPRWSAETEEQRRFHGVDANRK